MTLDLVMGRWLLFVLALVLTVASPWADFNRRHVFHPQWPAHAKFHNATYALMNMGCGALCLVLLVATENPASTLIRNIVVFILAWSAIIMLLAQFIPGVSAVADNEPIWRGQPVSFWSSLVFLALTLVGAVTY